eukprot:gene4057-5358_t
MASVWQRLSDIVGSVNQRTGVAGSLANLLDPDSWLPGGKDAALIVSLPAGPTYTDQVKGADGGTGDWVLYLLCITLAITPLRRLTGWNWVVKLRRMAGLFAFFYAFLHFLAFLWFDHFFDLQEMFKDVVKRPFITV